MIRLFVPKDLAPGPLEPTAEQARYLTQVMRRTLGDEVAVFNGRDGEWRARIATIGRRGCTLAVEAPTRHQVFGADLELVMAVVKRAPLEWATEKATELGVRRVRLVTTRRTNADHVRVERLTAIATEAAEQTGRLDVPEVIEPEPLERRLDAWDAERRLLFCDEGGDARPLLEVLLELSSRTARSADPGPPGARPSAGDPPGRGGPGFPLRSGRDDNGSKEALLIGPEGGFAPEERARLRGLPFVTPVSLGPHVLRADTAAISAMTLWQAVGGDWRAGLPGVG